MSYFYTVFKSRNEKLSDWLSKNFLLFCVALSIYVAIFVGRFSVARVFGEIFSEWFVLLEIRTWAITIAALLVFTGWRKCRSNVICPIHQQRVWVCLGFIAVAQLALMAHQLLYLPGASPAYFIWELATIILIAAILGFAFQVWGIQLVNTVMWLGLLLSLLIALWMLLFTISAKNTATSGLLPTTFTIYRIQIFGGFAALALLFECDKVVRGGWIMGISATICFATSYLTLSKAALLAGTGGVLFLAAIYVTWYNKIRAGVVLSAYLSAVILFVIISGGMFSARVSEGLLGTGYSLSMRDVLSQVPEGDDKLNVVRFEAQKRLAEVVACTAGNYPCSFTVQPWEQDIADQMLRFRVYIPDFSFRIRLLMEGGRGIVHAPWMGNGFGTFNAVATNLYTKEFEAYSHPHNIVVELLYSVGIMGTMIVGGIMFFLVWLVMQVKEGLQPGLPMLAYIVSVCIGAVFGGDYMDFRLAWFGFVFCIMLCAVGANKPAEARNSA